MREVVSGLALAGTLEERAQRVETRRLLRGGEAVAERGHAGLVVGVLRGGLLAERGAGAVAVQGARGVGAQRAAAA